eukprot:GHVS01065372.1.p1 GENE.GHVS01065372.1~~GHVS01065372.1.p1  ORF type:complete len:121 (-),score=16.67 GHVS01065372.1:228-590(-)
MLCQQPVDQSGLAATAGGTMLDDRCSSGMQVQGHTGTVAYAGDLALHSLCQDPRWADETIDTTGAVLLIARTLLHVRRDADISEDRREEILICVLELIERTALTRSVYASTSADGHRYVE